MLAGCSEQAGAPPGQSSEDAFSVDQTGIDVQVLQVWTPGEVFPRPQRPSFPTPGPTDVVFNGLDPAVCPAVETWSSPSSGKTNAIVDCSEALSKAAPFDGDAGATASPVMVPVRFQTSADASGVRDAIDPSSCNRVEVRVVVRDTAASQPTFLGVGFSTPRGEGLTPKEQLQAVGHVQLRNGDEATVFRFLGVTTCKSAHSSTTGNSYGTFAFKPYAAFGSDPNNPGAPRYRVWEATPNHVIGRSSPGESPVVNASGFDRASELLKR